MNIGLSLAEDYGFSRDMNLFESEKPSLGSRMAEAVTDVFEKIGNCFNSIYQSVNPYMEPGSLAADAYSIIMPGDGKPNYSKTSILSSLAGGVLGLLGVFVMFDGYCTIFEEEDQSKQIDGAITVIESFGNLISSTISLAEYAEKIRVISQESLNWVPLLGFINLAVSLISIVRNGKDSYDRSQFLESLKELKQDDNTYIDVINNLENLKEIGKYTLIEDKYLLNKIQYQIQLQKTDEEKEIAAKNIYTALIKKVEAHTSSDILTLVATTCNIIGTGILLGTGPAAPLCLVFLGASCVIKMYQYLSKRNEDIEFKKFVPDFPKEAAGLEDFYDPRVVHRKIVLLSGNVIDSKH